MEENRFCFVAIVKNEAHVIKRCLDSIANIATSYLICDTGSDDDTVQIIRSYMAAKNIEGEVIHEPWQNYGHNRSYLMDQAYTHKLARNAKYLIWHDADEVFLTNQTNLLSYPTKTDAAVLYDWLESRHEAITFIDTVYSDMRYKRWNIVKNNQLYKWLEPKHEYIMGTVDNSTNKYDKFILLARKEGGANKDPNRCQKDLKLFHNFIDQNGGPEKCPRTVFYLAQEYEYVENGKEKSIEWHKLRTTITAGYWQERYISCLRLGRLLVVPEEKIQWWAAGFKLDPARLECIWEIVNYYKTKSEWTDALKWAVQASEKREYNDSFLFIETKIYRYLFDLDYSLAAYYSGHYHLANNINQVNLTRNKNNNEIIARLRTNQTFIDQKLLQHKLIVLTVKDEEKVTTISTPSPTKVLAEEIKLNKIDEATVRFTPYHSFRPTILILDNFYQDPDTIRTLALQETQSQSSKSFATDELKNRFESILGKVITYWPTDTTNGSFQYAVQTQKSWIHRDKTEYSAVIYLTPHAPADSGTIFYRHKQSGKQYASSTEDENKMMADATNDEAWEVMDIVGNKYNRCIIFNGRCSHKSDEYFGTTKEDGKLFQIFSFNV